MLSKVNNPQNRDFKFDMFFILNLKQILYVYVQQFFILNSKHGQLKWNFIE